MTESELTQSVGLQVDQTSGTAMTDLTESELTQSVGLQVVEE